MNPSFTPLRHWFAAAAVSSFLIASSTARSQAPRGGAFDTLKVKAEVEAVYAKLRTSVVAKDYNAFSLLADSAKEVFPKEYFGPGNPMLLNRFPDPARMQFLRIDISGNWIGYYTQRPPSGGGIDIAFFLLRRAGDQLKISLRAYESEIPKSNDGAENRRAIDKELNSNASFRLPGQPGYVKQD
jgi:hypothetical protein